MHNLVQRNEKGQAITNSLLVAEKFNKEHEYVIRSIQNLISENSTVKSYFIETKYEYMGKSYPIFIMDRDGFTLLAMSFTGKEAIKFKMDFFNAFNKMDALLNSDDYIIMRSFKILGKKVKQLETDNARKDEIIEIQHETINELSPKAEYAEKVLSSKDTCTITQIAKELGLSAKTLNKKLKELHIQYRNGGQWVLYAKYQCKGLTKTSTYTEDLNGDTRTWHLTVWTEKGRKFIHDLINAQYIVSS